MKFIMTLLVSSVAFVSIASAKDYTCTTISQTGGGNTTEIALTTDGHNGFLSVVHFLGSGRNVARESQYEVFSPYVTSDGKPAWTGYNSVRSPRANIQADGVLRNGVYTETIKNLESNQVVARIVARCS